MAKKILIVTILALLFFQQSALAARSDGEIVFRDALYGAAIGGILASAIYLIDQDDFAAKFGTGIAIGTLGGLFFGVYETRGFAEIKGNEIKVALPTPIIQQKDNGMLYSVSILKADF